MGSFSFIFWTQLHCNERLNGLKQRPTFDVNKLDSLGRIPTCIARRLHCLVIVMQGITILVTGTLFSALKLSSRGDSTMRVDPKFNLVLFGN